MNYRGLAGISAMALTMTCGAPDARAAVINVPGDIASLSVAIAVAADGDEVVIASSASPYLVFPGLEVTDKTLIIRGATGNPADVVIDGANLDVVVRISGAGSDGTVLEGLTIQNGRGGEAGNSSGAGIRLHTTDVTIRDCVVRNNVIPAADGNGAGIYGTASDVLIERCVIEGNSVNSVTGDGVGAYFNGGSVQVVDSVFRDNRLPETVALETSSYGGGFYMDSGSLTMIRTELSSNRAGLGGGMYLSGTMLTVTIDETVFADGAARQGGGLYTREGSNGAQTFVRNSLFVGNTTTSNDAALYIGKGGFYTNLTIVGNTTATNYVVGGNAPTGSVIIDNTIIWGNTYNENSGLFPATTPEVVRRCILQQAFTGAAGSGFNQVIDPLFTDASNRDFRLMPNSPAIDAGDTNLYFGPFADLDGAARVVDVPEVADTGFTLSGPVIDIGAYEFQVAGPVDTCPTDTNGDGVINFTDLNAVLSVFGEECD